MQSTSPPTSRAPQLARRVAAGPWGVAVAAWIAARACVGAAFVVADLVASHLGATPAKRLHLDQALGTWDGTWYWEIAHRGYDAVSPDGLRFFPLYPMLGRVLGWPIGGHEMAPLLLISNLAALVALVLLHQLVVDETGDAPLARRAVWVAALFPAAGIMAFAYTEPLALALTLGAVLAARRRRWGWVVVLAFACGLTRPVGVFVSILLLHEAWQQWREPAVDGTPRPQPALLAAALAAPLVAMVGFLAWVDRAFGSWQIPLDEQRRLRGDIQDPFSRIWDVVHLTLTESRRDVFNLGFTVLLVGLLVVSIRTQKWGWWLFAVANLLVTLSSTVIDSTGRYGMVAFPLLVALAALIRRREVELLWVAASAGGLVALTTLHLVGGVVP